LKEKLFGSSGVRGVANLDLTPEFVLRFGLTLANFTAGGKIAVGFDTRLSSQMVVHSLIAGLLAGGAEVKNHGLIPTPVLAYLTLDARCKAGAMVTASHNPADYNGVKLFDKDGMAFNHDLENEIERRYNSTDLKRASWSALHTVETVDSTNRYIEMIRNMVLIEKPWKVVVDPGCGAAYSLGPRLFREQGCKVLTVNAHPDGFFPGRDPEPSADSLNVLSRIVKETGSDAGVAYDGDADRMAIIDETGELVPMDQLIAAYGAYLVSLNEKTIVVPVDASMCIEESIEGVGGNVIRTAVGDINVSEAVLKHNAALGAEASGAWINPNYSLCPDGILSSMLVLATVSSQRVNTTLSKFVNSISRYPILRGKVPCPDELKTAVMNEFQSELFKIMPEKSEILTIDGVRATSEDGWILIRPSGTEPVLRITVEAKDRSKAELLMTQTLGLMQNMIKRLSP
jgi:phosphoglucosamine mutase